MNRRSIAIHSAVACLCSLALICWNGTVQAQSNQTSQTSRSSSAQSSASSSSSAAAGSVRGNGAINGADLGNLLQNPAVFNGGFPGANQSSSRSISVSRNGKSISISENNETGITVTFSEEVDGKLVQKTVKAANLEELQRKSPEAFRLYQEFAGPKAGVAAAGLVKDEDLVGVEDVNRAESRSVSVSRNGKTISISEDESGITMTLTENVGGKEVQSVIQAANAEELKRKNAQAFLLYQQFAGNKDGGAVDAQAGLREQLKKMAEEAKGDPRKQAVIEQMLRNLEK